MSISTVPASASKQNKRRCVNPGCSRTYPFGQPYGSHTARDGAQEGTCSAACERTYTVQLMEERLKMLRADAKWQRLLPAT